MAPDFETLKSEILALHKEFIEAHLNKNVDFIVNHISEEYLAVSHGEIRKPTKEETRAQFTRYLNKTVFSEYKDLCEPIIGFSDDGSMAWSIVQVQVKGMHTMDDGSEKELDFTCAWNTIYKRQGMSGYY